MKLSALKSQNIFFLAHKNSGFPGKGIRLCSRKTPCAYNLFYAGYRVTAGNLRHTHIHNWPLQPFSQDY